MLAGGAPVRIQPSGRSAGKSWSPSLGGQVCHNTSYRMGAVLLTMSAGFEGSVERRWPRMLYRVRKTLRSGWFNHQVRGVLETPSARCDAGAGFLLLSQVCHSDLLMYLLAVKSFARFLPPAEIVVLDDGSLTKSDRDVLRAQLEGVRFLQVRDVPNARCPRGNCWERLLAVVDAAATSYVIQLDADSLTLRDPAELRDFVAGGSCFTLGTGSG